MTATLVAEHWLSVGAELGEGPAWDVHSDQLCFVDIIKGRMYRTDGAQLDLLAELDRPLGAALPTEVPDEYLLVAREGFWMLTDERVLEPLLQVLGDRPDLRFNDAKCDPAGRCLAGTLSLREEPAAASLLMLSDGPTARVLVDSVGLSNGLGWSPDGSTFFYADTTAGRVDQFDYDIERGRLGTRSPFVTVHAPDGLCVDAEGSVWVALWADGVVHKYTPDGNLAAIVDLPVPHATSCAFFHDLLIITTARATRADGSAAARYAGDLFAVHQSGVSAPPATPWTGGLGR